MYQQCMVGLSWTVEAIGEHAGQVYLVRVDGYQCPAIEVERLAA